VPLTRHETHATHYQERSQKALARLATFQCRDRGATVPETKAVSLVFGNILP